jgi:hypothetical protein
MPIKINDRTFMSFAQAVKYIMRTKGLTEERASAYVAGIEQVRKGKKKKRVRWQGTNNKPS